MKHKFFTQYFTKKLKNFIICVGCVIFGFAATIPYLTYVSYATTQDDVDQANSAVESLKEDQSSISSDISDLNSQIDAAGENLAEVDRQIDLKQDEIDSLQDQLSQLEIEKESQYEAMKLRIRYMYEHSDEDIFELLLSSQNLSDLLVRTEYIQKISEYDRDKLQEMQDLYDQEEAAQNELNDDMSQLSSLKQQADEELANLKSLLATRQSQYNDTSESVSAAEQEALSKEAELEEQKIAQEKAEAEEASREAEEASQEAESLAQAQASQQQSTSTQSSSTQSSSTQSSSSTTSISYDASDLSMLAALIECEAGNQTYEGMLAVGSVVINRVNSSRFPNTIAGVIYQADQFTPVTSGRFSLVLSRGANATCVKAAQEVLSGNITISALYFHVYRSGVDTYGTVIGDHIFY